MPKFSERHGYTKVRDSIQLESMDQDLKNGLWNCLLAAIWEQMRDTNYLDDRDQVINFFRAFWANYLKHPVDTLPTYTVQAVEQVKAIFYASEWFQAYDLVEFCIENAGLLRYQLDLGLTNLVNDILEKESAGYRVIDGQITPITDDTELSSIQEAMDGAPESVGIHLRAAMDLLSDRESPDYRNSIKESISAVEATVQQAVGSDKATLGDGLRRMEASHTLHPAMNGALNMLYGYSSDEGGIRHALNDDSTPITFEEAKFMLVACTAFINFFTASTTG